MILLASTVRFKASNSVISLPGSEILPKRNGVALNLLYYVLQRCSYLLIIGRPHRGLGPPDLRLGSDVNEKERTTAW